MPRTCEWAADRQYLRLRTVVSSRERERQAYRIEVELISTRFLHVHFENPIP